MTGTARTAGTGTTGTTPARDDRRVVLVTGASSGIGRAAAIAFADRARTGTGPDSGTAGVRLVLAARREDDLRETAQQSDPDAVIVPCDLATQAGIDQLLAVVRDQLGRLDVLVNNAGVGGDGPFDAPDALEQADRMLALNLRTPIALTHELLPLLRASRGAVVNVSSVAGLIGTPDAEVYSSTKWALTGFSEALRASQSRHGVHVACVQPGPVPTPGWPHARLAGSWWGRRVLASTADEIGRTIERASRRRGSVAPVRPRTYAVLPLLRGLAPWLVRRLLGGAARRDVRSRLHAPVDQDPVA